MADVIAMKLACTVQEWELQVEKFGKLKNISSEVQPAKIFNMETRTGGWKEK